MEIDSLLAELELEPDDQDEILALSSIFEENCSALKSGDNLTLNLQINPSDGERILSGQDCRVCFTLVITYGQTAKKTIESKMCKGLSTQRVNQLDRALIDNDDESVFDVIERVKDLIYEFNQSPDGECPICLNNYNGALYKAEECFHLFHAEESGAKIYF